MSDHATHILMGVLIILQVAEIVMSRRNFAKGYRMALDHVEYEVRRNMWRAEEGRPETPILDVIQKLREGSR